MFTYLMLFISMLQFPINGLHDLSSINQTVLTCDTLYYKPRMSYLVGNFTAVEMKDEKLSAVSTFVALPPFNTTDIFARVHQRLCEEGWGGPEWRYIPEDENSHFTVDLKVDKSTGILHSEIVNVPYSIDSNMQSVVLEDANTWEVLGCCDLQVLEI